MLETLVKNYIDLQKIKVVEEFDVKSKNIKYSEEIK
jgi:hypothetical protein